MKAILQKLLTVRKAIKTMPKDKRNDFNKYNYLSEAQVTVKMKELLDKNGIIFKVSVLKTKSIESGTTKSGNINFMTTVKIKYSFMDVDTGDDLSGYCYGQGMDTGDKGIYKAITGAVKYVFMKNF